MSREWNEWSKLILDEMKRFDQNHRDIVHKLGTQDEKLGDYNVTLARLTDSVEHHVKRSDQHEEHLKKQDEKITSIEDEVEGLHSHVKDARVVLDQVGPLVKVVRFVFSYKTLKWTIALLGVISGFFGTKYAIREYNILKNSSPEYKAKTK